jgi:hypothetical protein
MKRVTLSSVVIVGLSDFFWTRSRKIVTFNDFSCPSTLRYFMEMRFELCSQIVPCVCEVGCPDRTRDWSTAMDGSYDLTPINTRIAIIA